jgi:SPX domain protein involved in polyphosphate accumulation
MATTLQAARSAEPGWRYERKFEVIGRSLAELETLLRTHPAGFRTAFPAREVNNIYYDTHDLRSFRSHVNGSDSRYKLRIRWYGAEYGTVERPVLEMKVKQGMVGTKQRVELEPFANAPDTDIDALQPMVMGRIRSPRMLERMASSRPIVFNRYRRRYYESADRRFRITIDTELGFHDLGSRRIGTRQNWLERDLAVIELKYATDADQSAPDVVGALPFRLGKFSKYLRGISRLTGLEA